MKKLTWLIIVILCISLIPTFTSVVQAESSTWYVATAGSDAAAGDYAHPFKTIQKAVDVAVAGDTIYIRGGTYNQKVILKRSGTAGKPITITGYAGETTVIDGTGLSLPTGYGLIHLFAYKYITIKDLVIQNSPGHGIGTNFRESNPCRDITVYGCTFRNIGSAAINFWQEPPGSTQLVNMKVSHCYMENLELNMNAGECNTFRGCKDSVFEYNTMKGIGKIGVGICECTNVVIDHNVIDVTGMYREAFGIYIDGSQTSSGGKCNNITISNNLVYGNRQAIGFCSEIGSTSSLEDIVVVNNIVNIINSNGISCFFNYDRSRNFYDFTFKYNTVYVAGGGYCVSLDITASYLHNFVVANNIFASSGSASLTYCDFPSTESDLIRKNNLYYRTSGTPNTQFSDGTNKFESSAIKDNPDFVSLTSNNFHLTSTSPAIDAGSSTYSISYDYDDNPRPQGTGYDIGAYEYCSSIPPDSPPVFGTPTPSDGSTNNPQSFNWKIPINDPEGDKISWTIQCSNGQFNNGIEDTNGTKSLSLYGLSDSTTYMIWVNATDCNNNALYSRKWYTFSTIESQPPVQPMIHGPSIGKEGDLYTYNFVTTDPDGDNVYYWIDWGDGSSTKNWIGPYPSNQLVIENHSFLTTGFLTIRCKTKDSFDSVSDWSQVKVIILKENTYYLLSFFLEFMHRLIERFPQEFPMLNH